MSRIIMILFGAVILTVIDKVMPWSPTCNAPGQPCPVTPSFCCGGCCKNGVCINYGDDPDLCSNDPCSIAYCPPGKACFLEPVTCKRPPCRPLAVCK